MQRLARMDWLGTAFLLGSIISLLLALQDGGVVDPWNSPKQKGLLIAFGLLFVMFFIAQWFMRENASISKSMEPGERLRTRPLNLPP